VQGPDRTRTSLRRRLLANEVSVGPFLKIPSAEVTEIAALAGFGHVVIDLEHSQFTMETAVAVVRAAMARGIDTVVRTTEASAAEISRALDLGASGLIVPHVGSVEDATAVVRAARFHPLGERGMDLYARSAGWGAMPRDDYLRSANEDIVVGVMVEGAAAVDRLDEIAQVEGLDLLFIGPYDLSQSLGLPGQIEHPTVVEAIERAVKVATSHKKVIGLYVDSTETARRYRALGVRFIGMANDADVLRRRFTQMVGEMAEG
jgi:4-hydroxy-2-oxoheptanedioate aldolase